MTMCQPSTQLMEACFEKCSLGMGGKPKPLSALALCLGNNFHRIQRQEEACPVAGEFMKKCQQCYERNDCFWEKTKVPETLAAELKAYFGENIVAFSHQLEAMANGGSPLEVKLEFPVTWLLAHYKWDMPTALPFDAPDRQVSVLVAHKGHQSLIIAPLVGENLDDIGETAILSFHESVKEGNEFESLREMMRNSTVSNLSVILTEDLAIPPVRGGTYSWLISAYVLPYILRSDDIESFLSSVNGVSREDFLKIAHPLDAEVLLK